MTSKRGLLYEGFGQKKTAAEWARIAGLPRNSVCRYLATGWTVEEIFSYRRIKYDPQSDESEWMKRVGPHMTETINLIIDLLETSGYKPSAGAVKVSVLPNCIHHIQYRKQYLGWYEYKKGVLHLKDGNSLSLTKPVVERQKIIHAPTGEWWLHPETKRAILAKWRKEHDLTT